MNTLEEYKKETAAQDAAYKELHGVIYTASGHLIRLLNAGRDWDESLEIIVDLADDTRVSAYADIIGDALPESQNAVATSLEAFLHRLSHNQGEFNMDAEEPKHIDFGCDPDDEPVIWNPCPFCGGDDSMIVNRGGQLVCVCKDCGASGPVSTNQRAAIEGWNAGTTDITRTPGDMLFVPGSINSKKEAVEPTSVFEGDETCDCPECRREREQ